MIAAACLAAGALAGSTPVTITQADSGKTFRVSLHRHATLHLSGRWTWSTPVVQGRAVDLIQVNYFKDPGFSAWTIDPAFRGTVHIRSVGRPACRTCALKIRRFAVTVVVTAP